MLSLFEDIWSLVGLLVIFVVINFNFSESETEPAVPAPQRQQALPSQSSEQVERSCNTPVIIVPVEPEMRKQTSRCGWGGCR